MGWIRALAVRPGPCLAPALSFIGRKDLIDLGLTTGSGNMLPGIYKYTLLGHVTKSRDLKS